MADQLKVGFIINPIAGMGGRVGLKGTDGVIETAVDLGGKPVAQGRAESMLARFRQLQERSRLRKQVNWLTCSGNMGSVALNNTGIAHFSIVYTGAADTCRQDTQKATQAILQAGADIVVFCGGDGTARDIGSVVDGQIPILGVPSGVKMYSGLFGGTAQETAEILMRFINSELGVAEVDVLDLDEDAFRQDKWLVRLYQKAKTPFAPNLTQAAKAVISSQDDTTAKEEIADYLAELTSVKPQCLYLLGPGSTLQAIANRLSINKTLLGIDVMAGGNIIQQDVNEAQILALLENYPSHGALISPIGAQGFVLGRGNLPISPDVIRRIGVNNITVVATPAKLASLEKLRFDTGDTLLDDELASGGYLEVITGYHRSRMVACQKTCQKTCQNSNERTSRPA